MMDREKAIEILQRIADDKTEELHICDDEGGSVCGLILEEQNAILAGIEALKEQRPHGEWIIYHISMYDGEDCKCSVCGKTGCVPYWQFCPQCGASMEEGEVE